jgi:predicted AAA+ superfamily ATPase
MKRIIDGELEKWAQEESPKPLLLRGARQVGKTYAVRKLGRRFTSFVEINFDENPETALFFKDGLSAAPIVEKLSAYAGRTIVPGETLLFFDEVQACPKALASLRYFREQMPRLHVLAAGSLLEFALQDIPSLGVGRLTSRFMYPMTFTEFLSGIGDEALLGVMEQADYTHPLDEPFHRRLVGRLRTYMTIGGLPEVVAGYARNHDLNAAMDTLDDLLLLFQNDFAKYRKRVPAARLAETFRSAALQAGGKFVCARVSRDVKSTAIRDALELLVKAGLVLKVRHTNANGVPLGADAGEGNFKTLLADMGLHQRLLGLDLRNLVTLDDTSFVNRGALAEVYAGLQIAAHSSMRHRPELYYWHREAANAMAEVDYVLQRGDALLPVEVKSGLRGRMKSLRLLMAEKKIPFGIRLSLENFSSLPDVGILPLYAVHRLCAETPLLSGAEERSF